MVANREPNDPADYVTVWLNGDGTTRREVAGNPQQDLLPNAFNFLFDWLMDRIDRETAAGVQS